MNTVNIAQPIESLHWSVKGMDCAGCAVKIKGAIGPVPGVLDVSVSVMGQTLTVGAEAGSNPAAEIERRVSLLGYDISRQSTPKSAAGARATPAHAHDHEHHAGHDHHHGHDHADGFASRNEDEMRWFDTSKGRLVVTTGALLGFAVLAKLLDLGSVVGWGFTLACVIGVVPIARRAIAALSMGQPFTIEMLMTVAAAGALAIGAAEEAALVVFLFAIGEVLEGVAADRARAGIRALGDLIPQTALVVTGGSTREVRAATLVPDQIVLVRPGDRIPADGEIASGNSGIDESPVTGESVPKSKSVGDPVFAGSINREAAIEIRVTRRAEDNTISRIIRLVEEAQDKKVPTERFIDRFSRLYMPAIVALALLVAIVPPLAIDGDWQTWIYRALALLLIGCPCALVISVPASIASSLSAGARRGLLLKGGAVIEAAALTQVVAFDKTGTLTQGKPTITDVRAFHGSEGENISFAASVEAQSSHPLAQAVSAEALRRGLTVAPASQAAAIPGRGVEALVAGAKITVASPRYAAELGALPAPVTEILARLQGDGKTVVVVVRDGVATGLIAFRDEPRADAKSAIDELTALGVRAVMLTGDNAATGRAIAGALGIDVRAELLPDAKVDAIRELAKSANVMMIGDGINDAPALASASVGIAMGSGTAVALETADGALMGDRVADAPRLIRLARATMANIRQNIAMALALKAVFLVTSVLGLTGLWIAILADTGATVLVTLNALRLLRFNSDVK